jgi:hypothetical protein
VPRCGARSTLPMAQQVADAVRHHREAVLLVVLQLALHQQVHRVMSCRT